MRKFDVVFVDRITALDRPPSGLTFTPQRFSQTYVGGMDTAEIGVAGPVDSLFEALRLLGDNVSIFNEDGTKVWYGYAHEAEISLGGITYLASLETVANRIAVVYTDTRADGSSERKTTAWAEDTASIAKFGIKELRPSFEGTDTEADAFRAKELARLAWPPRVRRIEEKPIGGMIFCKGPWHRLGWQYYQNLAGLEEYTDTGPGEQFISASYTATTISFAAQDDILDSANGLGSLQEGDEFTVSGAADAANNGEFTVKTTGAGAIETVDKGRVTAAAGPSITISLGGSRVDRVAQSFTLTNNTPAWTVAAIAVRARKVGSPSESLLCALCSDSAGSPGAVLEQISLASSNVSTEMGWIEFTFGNTISLSFGTTYWIQMYRGSQTIVDYYVIEVNEEAGYTGGQVKVYNGSSWSVRSPAADMPFRVTGKVATTEQVRTIVEANAEFGAGSVVIFNASGISTWQYRDGDGLASDEVADLLAQGLSSGESYVAKVLESRRVIVYRAPAASDIAYVQLRDGRIRPAAGAPMPPGQTIAGVWVEDEYLPPLDVFAPAAASGDFVTASEYDAATDRLTFDTEGSLSVWQGQNIRTG